jgi:branched-chain amino acid transport system ATP-binding protein
MRLEVTAVRAGYATGEVLHGVDLDVASSGVTALLGPNGAGKSTLLRVIAGLLRPTAGSVRLDGREITGHGPEELARCGIYLVPEGRAVFPSLTVAENLRLASGAPERRVRDRLSSTLDVFPRLRERLAQTVGTMSGGEQQMLALARAFAADPALLLLDEPSLGLAPVVIDEVFGVIGRFRQAGVSVVLVEQYVHRAMAIADRVAVLAKGAVVFAGDPRSITADEVADRYLGEVA